MSFEGQPNFWMKFTLDLLLGSCLKCLHCTLRDCSVTLLFVYSLGCCLSHQTFSVSINKSPWPINKSPNDFCRACIQDFQCTLLGLCKVVLRMLPVLVFAPPPVLRAVVRSIVADKQNIAYHFNGIQLAVKLWQEKALMASTLDKYLQHWFLICKISLLREKPGHATILAFKWAYWCTLCLQMWNIEPMFFKNSLQAFLLSRGCCHLLWLSLEVQIGVWLRNFSIALLSAIRFIHFKSLQSIWQQRSMGRGLVKNEQGLAVRVSSLV